MQSSHKKVSTPPSAWIERVEVSLDRVHGVGTRYLLERDRVLAELFGLDLEPEAVIHRISAEDLVIARWLSRFCESTWRTYERALRHLASDMELSVAPTARALLRRAAKHPDAVAKLVRKYVARRPASTGTLRLRLTALRRAMHALHASGLAKRFNVESPEDEDVDLTIPQANVIAEIDDFLKQASDLDALAARTRAEFLLAVDGLRAHEIRELTIAQFRLSAVTVGDEVVRISERTSDALRRWLLFRGTNHGPVFLAFDSKLREFGREPLTRRSLERDLKRASNGRLTMRALRRFAVVTAVREGGWSSGERIARLTSVAGVVRMVDGARSTAKHADS